MREVTIVVTLRSIPAVVTMTVHGDSRRIVNDLVSRPDLIARRVTPDLITIEEIDDKTQRESLV